MPNEIRFAVGSKEDLRSSVWQLWANKNNDNLYLKARAVATTSKVSFHESGICRYAKISNEPRPAHRSWERPPEIKPNVIRMFSVVVFPLVIRNRFLDKIPPQNKPTVFIPPPTLGRKVIVGIFLVKGGVDLRTYREGNTIINFHGTVQLKSGVAWLVSYTYETTVDELQYVLRTIAEAKIPLKRGIKKEQVAYAHLHILEMSTFAPTVTPAPWILDLQLSRDNIVYDKS